MPLLPALLYTYAFPWALLTSFQQAEKVPTGASCSSLFSLGQTEGVRVRACIEPQLNFCCWQSNSEPCMYQLSPIIE